MDKYKYVLNNKLIKLEKDGTVYKKYKDGTYKEAPQHKTGRYNKYKAISIYFNKKQHHLSVHRLMATNYLPNPENKETVNHKDGNGYNNKIENLEWATYSENTKHAFKSGFFKNKCIYCNELTQNHNQVCEKCKTKIEKHKKSVKNTLKRRENIKNINIKSCNGREKRIVYLRYMGKTLQEIGNEFNISRERIRQILSRLKNNNKI